MSSSLVFSTVGTTGAQKARKVLLAVIVSIAAGCIVAMIATFMLVALRPVLVAAAFCALAVFLPTLVLREPKLYWLVLFVFSVQFDISKRLTVWMAEPWRLFEQYGTPASGNLSIHFYLSDVILCMLIIPWVLKLVRRQEQLFFPTFCYIPLAYFGWTLFSSLVHAVSLHLSFFEWVRQILYFISLVYIANNVTSERHVRALVFALTAALFLQAAIVHVVFQRQTTSYLLGGVYRERNEGLTLDVGPLYASEKDAGSDNRLRRSRGTFAHSSHAAYYFEYILPLMLLLSFSHPNRRRRWLYLLCLVMGGAALFLTFSRSGFVGFLFGAGVTLFLARQRNLLSRQLFTMLAVGATIVCLILAPKVYNHLTARPESFSFRFELLEAGIDIFMGQPLLGVGLNNSSAVSERFHPKRHQSGSWEVQIIHNHYLILAIETGLIGFLLYFGFFGNIMYRAWQCTKSNDLLLANCATGILGAFAAIALHNMGDPFGGHTLHAMLWLYAGLILALPRIEQLQSESPIGDELQALTAGEAQ